MNYTLDIQEHDSGQLCVTLPDDLLEELDWQLGDVLEWDLKGQGVILSRLNEADNYEVETA